MFIAKLQWSATWVPLGFPDNVPRSIFHLREVNVVESNGATGAFAEGDCSRCPVLLEDSGCASMCPAPLGKQRPSPSCHGGAGEPASPRVSPTAGPSLRLGSDM